MRVLLNGVCKNLQNTACATLFDYVYYSNKYGILHWGLRQGFSLDFHFSIFPFWGMRKMNQFPLAEKDFPTDFQKITKMGMEI